LTGSRTGGVVVERTTDPIEPDQLHHAGFDTRRVLKSAALRVAKAGFSVADLALGSWPGPRVLIYHQVESGTKGQMDVPASRFRRQVEWLATRGRFARLEDVLTEAGSDDAERVWVLTFDDGYEDVYDHAFPVMRDAGIPFTLYLTTRPMEQRTRYDNGAAPLTWDQVNEMISTGLVTVGAHTHTHPDLRHLSRDRIADEFERSNRLIVERTGIVPRHFCYPKGYWSADAEEEIADRYDTATLGAGHPVTERTNPFRIHRVPVQRSDGEFFFKQKMKSGLRLEESARRAIKRYHLPSVEFDLAEA
jgi:peptidoglycan/xylan/chitin deacetylase (PgdA/CDA1 family)